MKTIQLDAAFAVALKLNIDLTISNEDGILIAKCRKRIVLSLIKVKESKALEDLDWQKKRKRRQDLATS